MATAGFRATREGLPAAPVATIGDKVHSIDSMQMGTVASRVMSGPQPVKGELRAARRTVARAETGA